MNLVLAGVATIVLLSALYCHLQMRKARREAAEAQTSEATTREGVQNVLDATQGVVNDFLGMHDQAAILYVTNTLHRVARDQWKALALALEVLCECCADRDEAGADNARKEAQRRRDALRIIGEYDD